MDDRNRENAHLSAPEAAAALLDVIRGLVAEVRPEQAAAVPVELDASLDKDLGLDSLTRMELVERIETRFGMALAPQILADAESPRDLLRAVLSGVGPSHRPPPEADHPAAAGPSAGPPHMARTLMEVLDWHAQAQPDRLHVRFYRDDGEGESLRYADLRGKAETLAAGLQARGLKPAQPVAIMLPTGADYFHAFFGILLAGGVPVPIYPPARRNQLEEHLLRHRAILNNCAASTLITVPEAQGVARLLQAQAPELKHLVTTADLASAGGRWRPPPVKEQDLAFIQYTSGSTGQPKGVMLTHANLLANLRAMGRLIRVRPEDVFVSWLPLYHDMGLIGAWLGGLYFAYTLVVMSPLDFLARPLRWLDAIHRHRGTLSAAPNFAYELALKRLAEADLGALDLSSWRCAFNGAEPVSPATLERFAARFREAGLAPEALMPVYGLAEGTLGVAFPPLGRGWQVDAVEREVFSRTGEARPAKTSEGQPLEFVSSGHPLTGHEIRIVDPGGRELPERREGRVQFRGPSACSGYYRNPEATRALFEGDWLETGDKGYIAGGELYLTGRTKDMIIRAGRNIYPSEVEEALGEIPGIRKGNVAVFGSPDPRSGTERLVVLAETRETGEEAHRRLRAAINARTADLASGPPDEIVLAPPGSVLKTSSGKIRRAASRERFERGRIGRGRQSFPRQLIRLTASAVPPLLRRARGALLSGLYNLGAWTLIALALPFLGAGVGLLPRLTWRWSLLRWTARLLLGAMGIPLTVRGPPPAPLPQGPIYVSNHASYMDSAVLIAALPGPLCFVAKAELRAIPVVGVLLERIGTVFAERFDKHRGAADARRLQHMAAEGRPLVFFAEGTISRMPGLLAFRMGAFLAAARSGRPIVPVTIRGTRSILRSDTWFFRRGPVRVTLGAPLTAPAENDGPTPRPWAQAVDLHNRTREHILRHCGEPDLAAEALPLNPGAAFDPPAGRES
jgi:1-acyl-sn-glycerol-3-phosphate acyltransferase